MRQTKEQKKQMMLEGNIKSLIIQMGIPTIVAQLITTIYNLADTFFVSTLGTNAIAAVGVNHSLERSINMFGMLIAAGASSYISRLLGAKKDEDADRVLSTSLFFGVIVGLLLAVFGSILMNPMVNLLGATEDCRGFAIDYATYVLYAAPFMVGSYILNQSLRSEGSAHYAMIGIGFGGILNCFLDPLFIFVFGLGVKGASMATAISKVVSFIILLVPYIRKHSLVKVSIKRVKLVFTDVKEVVSIGSTSFFRTCFAVIASIVINRVAGEFSTSALAALSLANRVMDFPFAIILGFGQGYQPVVGFNWGARKKERVKEGLNFALSVSVIGAALVGVIIFAFAKEIIYVFNSEADTEVLRLGMLCIRLQSITLPIHSGVSIVNMFYGGAGKAKYALLLSTARQGYCFLIAALILPRLFGVYGVTAVQATADLMTLLIVIPLLFKAYRFIRELEPEAKIS